MAGLLPGMSSPRAGSSCARVKANCALVLSGQGLRPRRVILDWPLARPVPQVLAVSAPEYRLRLERGDFHGVRAEDIAATVLWRILSTTNPPTDVAAFEAVRAAPGRANRSRDRWRQARPAADRRCASARSSSGTPSHRGLTHAHMPRTVRTNMCARSGTSGQGSVLASASSTARVAVVVIRAEKPVRHDGKRGGAEAALLFVPAGQCHRPRQIKLGRARQHRRTVKPATAGRAAVSGLEPRRS